MKRAKVFIFSSFHTVSNIDSVVMLFKNIIKANNSVEHIEAVFENEKSLDYRYYGYCPKDDYIALKAEIARISNSISEVSHRTLFYELVRCIEMCPVILIGISVQELRTLKTILSHKQLKNIRDIYLYNSIQHNFIKRLIDDPLVEMPDAKTVTLNGISAAEFERITKEKIDDYIFEGRIKSQVFKPKNKGNGYLYKVLIGEYPLSWIEKITLLQEISVFLDSKGIIHAIPYLIIHDGIVILKEKYIDGLFIYSMVSYSGLTEHLFGEKNRERSLLVAYLKKICKAISFYHFLGVYISDIKEDNFVLYKHEIIPIDADGFSYLKYPSSQPQEGYRRYANINDETVYSHNSISERYALSLLIFKILFGNTTPYDEDNPQLSIIKWRKQKYTISLSTRVKQNLQFWNALPDYIKEVLEFEFCDTRDKINYFDSNEWYLLISQYSDDLEKGSPAYTYLNKANVHFGECTRYFLANKSIILLKVIKAVLSALNILVFISCLILLFYSIS